MTPSIWWLTLGLLTAVVSEQRLDGATLAAQVREQVQARTRASGSQARVELAGPTTDQTLPAGALDIEVGDIAGRWPRARAGVPVRLRVDGHTARTTTIWLHATDERTVATYARDYDAAAQAATVRTSSAVVDMVCCPGETGIDATQVPHRRLRRAVRAGEPVMREDFVPLPLVVAQAPVAVAVERGPVRIVTRGVALQDGAMGERILVRPQQSRHAVAARVIQQGEVVVDE